MLIMPSFKKSLIVEQFQGNYLKSILPANWNQQYGGPAAILDDAKIPLLSGDAGETTEKSESGFREEKSERMKQQKAVSDRLHKETLQKDRFLITLQGNITWSGYK